MDAIGSVFTALADPTRRAILVRLAQGEATVGVLSRPFEISAPAISRHLKVLEQAELITNERRGKAAGVPTPARHAGQSEGLARL